MNIHRMRYLVMYWIALAQHRYRRSAVIIGVMKLWDPQIAGISCLTSFSGKTLLHGVSKLVR